MSVLVSDILLPPCGFELRFLTGERRGDLAGYFSSYHPNREACSGTTGFPRGLLPDSDPGRCPKIKTELPSMASSTRLALSDRVVSRLPGASREATTSCEGEVAGNSF